MLSNYSAPFVRAPMFVTSAQTDSVQLCAHDWVPRSARAGDDPHTAAYLAAWKANQTQGLRGFVKGAGKGLVGLALKPAAGMLDLASRTMEGFANTFEYVEDAVQLRDQSHLQGIWNRIASCLAQLEAKPKKEKLTEEDLVRKLAESERH